MPKKPTIVEGEKTVCSKCDKEHVNREPGVGNPVGSSSLLGRNIMRNKARKNHPLHYTTTRQVLKLAGSKTRGGRIRKGDELINVFSGSLQAHHIICSATFAEDEDWQTVCKKHGYNINHMKNGVFLPGFMDLACKYELPVHNTNHDGGETTDISSSRIIYMAYPMAVKERVKKIIDEIEEDKTCELSQYFIKKMNNLSKEICEHVLLFTWTITRDGKDYKEGEKGCGNAKIPSDKKESCKRIHNITLSKPSPPKVLPPSYTATVANNK